MKAYTSFLFIIFVSLFSTNIQAQLSLEDCRQKAQDNFPAIRKYQLIKKSEAYNLSNAAKAWLPQVQLNVRASYQSAVTEIPIELPGLDIPKLKQDQYVATLEASQVIWDGGAIRSQQKITKAVSEVERQQLETELYAVNERVNQLFFGILLCDEQQKQNQLLMEEIGRNYEKVKSYVALGVANSTDLDAVKVEELNAKQIRTQIESTRRAFVEMLGLMIGKNLDEKTVLQMPEMPENTLSSEIERPELKLFQAQNRLYESQKSFIQSAYMPKIGLFLQGGYGRPGLNMLSNSFDWFYIGGLRLSWNFGALYTQKNDLQKIGIDQNRVETQRDVFLYNLNLAVSQENQEIKRLREIMHDDDEIIALRENIRKATEAKMANGTATVTDLMRDLTQENMARQTKAAHTINLLKTIYDLKNTTNN